MINNIQNFFEITGEDYYSLGRVYIRSGEQEKGIDYYNSYLKEEQTKENRLFNIAFYFDRIQRYAKSLSIYESLRDRYPNNFQYFYYPGIIYQKQAEYQKSINYLKKAISLSTQNIEPWFQLAVTYEKKGNFTAAEKYFQKAIEKKPTFDLALNYLGYIYAENNQNLSKAKELINKALVIEPHNPAYLDSMAWCYYKKENYEKAGEYIKKAVKRIKEKNETDPLIYEHAGDIFHKKGDKKQAKKYWQKALSTGSPNKEKILDKMNSI